MNDVQALMLLGICVALFAAFAYVASSASKAWAEQSAHRASADRDHAYEALADKAVYNQQKLLEQQEQLLAEVTEVKNRVLAIEQKLAEVD